MELAKKEVLTEKELKFVSLLNKYGCVSVYDLNNKHNIKIANMQSLLIKLEQLGFLLYQEQYLHKGRDHLVKKSYRYGLYDVIKGSEAEKILENL